MILDFLCKDKFEVVNSEKGCNACRQGTFGGRRGIA